MKTIYDILRSTVMVLSVLSLVVSSGGTFAQSNWQQHQQLQNTQLAETQANFEQQWIPEGRWQGNEHLDITP